VNGRPYRAGQVLDSGDRIVIGQAPAAVLIEVRG
jgi:hypothetical protein